MATQDDTKDGLLSGEEQTIPVQYIQETKPWDVFQNEPPVTDGASMADQKCVAFTMKLLKVVAYLLIFVIVLGSGVIAKGTMLLMTSQIKEDKRLPFCKDKYPGHNSQFVVQLPEVERIAWLWCLLIAYLIPELGSFLRSLRVCFFKSWKIPTLSSFSVVFIMETLHTVGMAILIFVVLPNLNVVTGVMLTNCVCFVPGLLGLLSRTDQESRQYLKMAIDFLALLAQLTGFIAFPLLQGENKRELWLIPAAVFLISCGWWENYVTIDSPYTVIKRLGRVGESLKKTRYFTYLFVSLWKMACFFGTLLLIIHLQGQSVAHFFTEVDTAFSTHNITILEIKPEFGGQNPVDLNDVTSQLYTGVVTSNPKFAIYVLIIQVVAAYLCFIFGKFACRILIQGFSYAFPVNLTVPVTISILIALCGLRNVDPCYYKGFIPSYLFFESPPVYFESWHFAWVWLLWLLSQSWITLHIWAPKAERLANTEKLFVTPMYNGLLVDQSLGLNRRRDDEADIKIEELDHGGQKIHGNDHVTRIFACCTMWHENKEEMMEMLKSILRLDEDQSAREVTRKYLKVVDPDYYKLETHIFFDDAFTLKDKHDEYTSVVNSFVRILVSTLDEAASIVHETNICLRPPTMVPTPYGGRLIWILPGKTKLIVHLKDKSKIRHKKRWSQVMYMYYLLGNRLMERDIHVDRKEVIAQNTYLLALDGDIDFQPNAVHLLVHLMKKNRNLGAACGRIHPIGSGPMVWYQKFEYAIGHWLQKATEHIIGCVLCSPGCFSLFRAKALMDDNVMKKYTTVSDEARHYVQYDQGEDRWLCTLLLQRGYRVEYCAASDAYTHAPESFNEFFNQRRRWVPSTMANIMDLLMDYKKTIRINENISFLYICYQIFLMVGTILGPGTIFLMLVGAFVAAFDGIDNWTSLQLNIYPILVFMLVCMTCNSKIQLMAAKVISSLYGLLMMAVFIGIMVQIEEDGPLAPSSLFLFIVAGELIIAAFLHPQEFWCLPCGIIYYVTIPSMYLLLIIYSVFNMNDVTWGTRDVAQERTKQDILQEKKDAEEAKKVAKNKSMLGFLSNLGGNNEKEQEGSIECSLAGLFKCSCCTHPKANDDQTQLMVIAEKLDGLGKRFQYIERVVDPDGHVTNRRRSTIHLPRDHNSRSVSEKDQNEVFEEDECSSVSSCSEPKTERDDLINPYWMEDRDVFARNDVDFLSSAELQFWKGMLDKYLHPIDEDKDAKARIAKELKDLRDTTVFAFFMLNALFVLVVYLLQLKKDTLYIVWPFHYKSFISFDEANQQIIIRNEYLHLEPIGVLFLLSFALILLIQFTAMLIHRFGTLSHILSSTDLNWFCSKKPKDFSKNAIISQNFIEIARELQRLRNIDGDNSARSSEDKVDRRKTIHNLERHKHRKPTVGNLDEAFQKRLFTESLEKSTPADNPKLRRQVTFRDETFEAFKNRRKSVIYERRKSLSSFRRPKDRAVQTAGSSVVDSSNDQVQLRGHVNNAFVPDSDDYEMIQDKKRPVTWNSGLSIGNAGRSPMSLENPVDGRYSMNE